MKIIKGDKNFSIVGIEPKELSNIYDGMQNGRYYLQQLLKEKDVILAKSVGIKTSEVKEIRKIFKEKIEFYEKHLLKIQSYATK